MNFIVFTYYQLKINKTIKHHKTSSPAVTFIEMPLPLDVEGHNEYFYGH